MPVQPHTSPPLATLTDVRELLERAGYDADAERIAIDPDLQDALHDPGFLAWLEAGAPGNGATTERVALTRKGYRATTTRPCLDSAERASDREPHP